VKKLNLTQLRKSLRSDSAFWHERDPRHLNGIEKWIAVVGQILVLSTRGLLQNQIFSKAAALSYGSLMALGPLVAVSVIVSTAFIRTDAESQIKNLLVFIAPNLQEFISIQEQEFDAAKEDMANALDALITQIVQGADALFSQINTGGSTIFGFVSIFLLFFLIIELLTSVETTLNQIWGVKRGRPWGHRVVFYWTIVTLGAIIGLGTTVLFSASNIVHAFEGLPLGGTMTSILVSISPWISALILTLLLCFFYLFFPNTKVQFRAAFIGSLIATLLLFLNQYLSILYIQRVISIQSLYGSVGIIPILMLGIFIFWILILLGAQLTYTIQNRALLAKEIAWSRINEESREALSFLVFAEIARAFEEGQQPPGTHTIARHYALPMSVVNEAVSALRDLGWINSIQLQTENHPVSEEGYVPAKPLHQLTIGQFKAGFKTMGKSFPWRECLSEDSRLSKIVGEWTTDRHNDLTFDQLLTR